MGKNKLRQCLLVCGLLTIFLLAAFASAVQVMAKTSIASPAADFNINQLNMVNENAGWAWTQEGHLLHTMDGGTDWDDVTPTIVQVDPAAEARFDAQSALLKISDGTYIRTTDGGQSWQNVNLGNLPDQAKNFKLEYHWVTPSDGWVAWEEGAAGNGYVTVYETHDGGASYAPASFSLPDVALPNTIRLGNICGAGYYFSFHKIVIISGTLACGDGGAPVVLVYHNNGQTQIRSDLPYPADLPNGPTRPEDPVFITDQVGYLNVEFLNSSHSNSVYRQYITRDGGNTWSLAGDQQSFSPQRSMPRFFTGSKAFSICNGSLCVTNDGGLTWQNVPSDFNFARYGSSVVDMQFASATAGWLILKVNGSYYFYKTTDGGAHWQGPTPPQADSVFEGQIAYMGPDGSLYLMRGDPTPIRMTGKLDDTVMDLRFSRSGRWLSYIVYPDKLHVLDTASPTYAAASTLSLGIRSSVSLQIVPRRQAQQPAHRLEAYERLMTPA